MKVHEQIGSLPTLIANWHTARIDGDRDTINELAAAIVSVIEYGLADITIPDWIRVQAKTGKSGGPIYSFSLLLGDFLVRCRIHEVQYFDDNGDDEDEVEESEDSFDVVQFEMESELDDITVWIQRSVFLHITGPGRLLFHSKVEYELDNDGPPDLILGNNGEDAACHVVNIAEILLSYKP